MLLFAVMCVVWGIPYLMIKVADQGVSVPVLVFARTAGGAALLLPLAARTRGWGVLRRHWRPVLAFAATEILGPWSLLSDAERRLSSSLAGLLVAAVPIVGVLLARLTGDTERLGVARWIGLIIGLGGVALLAAPDLGGGTGWAVAEVGLVTVGYATAPMIANRKLREVPNLPLTATCLTIAALVYAPAAALTWPAHLPSGRVLAALAGLAVICTALGFLVFLELIREVGTSRAMVFTYVTPAVTVAAGVLLLGEPLTSSIIGAFVLIILGSVLATVSRPARDQGLASSSSSRLTSK